MEHGSVELLVRPETTAIALGFIFGGITLGTISGLTPGIHVNNFALMLAAAASSVPGPSRLIGAAMLAAGTVHTFLDVVPALALGVPDPAMAPSALPGHRLVLAGRGREALRLSALGSGLAIVFAVPLAIPITRGMTTVYPALRTHLSVLLGAVAALLVLTERSHLARVGAALAVLASGLLGVLTLDLSTGGLTNVGGPLLPLFAGLFGAPILLEAVGGDGVPPQAGPVVTTSRPWVIAVAFVGTVAGAVVGYIPGISSAIAATAALVVIPSGGPRGFVTATSGVNTANAIFALFALVSLGSPRTGVMVAFDGTNTPVALPLLLTSVVIAAATGFVLVCTVGDRYLSVVGRLDNTKLSIAVLGLLTVIVSGFGGLVGIAIFIASTLVGSIPARFNARRVTLMGVLLVPLALG